MGSSTKQEKGYQQSIMLNPYLVTLVIHAIADRLYFFATSANREAKIGDQSNEVTSAAPLLFIYRWFVL